MSPAQELKELSIALDTVHILSDFPGSIWDRLQKDLEDGIDESESIENQIREHKAALKQVREETEI